MTTTATPPTPPSTHIPPLPPMPPPAPVPPLPSTSSALPPPVSATPPPEPAHDRPSRTWPIALGLFGLGAVAALALRRRDDDQDDRFAPPAPAARTTKAITVTVPIDEVRQHQPQLRELLSLTVEVTSIELRKAPRDQGTEIVVTFIADGKVDELRARDDLRRFKQIIETGQVMRSDATPGGLRTDQLLLQRPAQPFG